MSNFKDPSIRTPISITTARDEDGQITLWFTNQLNNSIGRITTSGVVTNFTAPVVSYPKRLTPGPDADHALWFTNNGSNSVAKFDSRMKRMRVR